MRRIRVVLALVSLATFGLVALLAWRASEGLAAERAMRHEAVAERTFEEMERALTDFLAREEARPVGHYADVAAPDRARSPLAAELEPFVVGAFQLDPEGEVTTPLAPSDGADGDAAADRFDARRVRSVVDGLWSSNAAALRDEAKREGSGAGVEEELAKGDERQAPGTTRAVSGPGVAPGRGPGASEPAPQGEARSAYDVLERLNRAADDRTERKQQVARAPKATVSGAVDPDSAEREAYAALAASRAFAAAPPASGKPSETLAPALRMALDPMVGVSTGADLVLYRTVLVDRRAYRQGLVLDRAALGAWLEDRVIRASGLADVARVSFRDDPRPPEAGHFVFDHRFAEPFDALHARLALAPLPGVASPGALYALVIVLLAIGAAGFVAVHRTVSIAVGYAERRSNFVAAVTHELKTPLTAIRMYAEMLRDGLVSGDAKRQEYYATITDESERLSRLVDNVLEFSKLEGGRRELSTAVGAIGPVLEEAAEKLAAHAAREGFTLSVDVDPDLPVVRFDRDALLQVIFNLVDNAMKYAKTSDERRIELAAHREGESVGVSVRDFGPGVARVHQERIFEPFYRGESELTRTTKGTGIGLALVKELAERMGASVHGANADGGGFRVGLAFPPERPA